MTDKQKISAVFITLAANIFSLAFAPVPYKVCGAWGSVVVKVLRY
jgi:hypothetical protein